MKIAFDVKGTIEGSKGHMIIEALRALKDMGHECVVWSNLYGYAVDAVNKYELNVVPESKRSVSDLAEYDREPYDFCIEDDRSQTWLGAKNIIFVDEIESTEYIINRVLGKI